MEGVGLYFGSASGEAMRIDVVILSNHAATASVSHSVRENENQWLLGYYELHVNACY